MSFILTLSPKWGCDTWPHISTWEIKNIIIHGFVDELGVVDENKGYVPPHVLLTGDTQFGLGVAIVIIDA